MRGEGKHGAPQYGDDRSSPEEEAGFSLGYFYRTIEERVNEHANQAGAKYSVATVAYRVGRLLEAKALRERMGATLVVSEVRTNGEGTGVRGTVKELEAVSSGASGSGALDGDEPEQIRKVREGRTLRIKFTGRQLQRMRTMRKHGATRDAIAAKFSISLSTVDRALNGTVREKDHPRNDFTSAEMQAMQAMHTEGYGIRPIARKFHRSEYLIRNLLRGVKGGMRQSAREAISRAQKAHWASMSPEQRRYETDKRFRKVKRRSKSSKGQSAYWAQFTPEQRSEMMKQRREVAARNQRDE